MEKLEIKELLLEKYQARMVELAPMKDEYHELFRKVDKLDKEITKMKET